LDPGEAFQHAGVATISPSQTETFHHAWHTLIEH
jgi:hypothetical protein